MTEKIEERINFIYRELDCLAPFETIGETGLGREIRRYRFGENAKVLLVGGVHAREWITVLLLTELAKNAPKGLSFDLIPCLNPDGMALALEGKGSVKEIGLRERLVAINGGEDFSMWKANAFGVDVNVNFDADWGEGKKNVTFPGAENYIGESPESEKETQAAVYALQKGYSLIACYHSLGEEVYWGYESNFRHYAEAKEFADYIGYTLKRSEGSAGGMKDYYATYYDGLGLTVEVGEEKYGHPYPEDKLGQLVKKHEGSLEKLVSLGERIDGRIHGGGDRRSGKGV